MATLTGFLLSGCSSQGAVVDPNRCASGPMIADTPAAPTGTYSGQASEQVYKNLLTPSVRKPSAAGALKIVNSGCMMTLADAKGKPIQLRGMSTHGLQWFPEIVNNNAFAALSKNWGSNVVRLAMYVGEGGYATKPEVKQKVFEGIDLAIKNDMYVIVDWHVHAPGDPGAELYTKANPMAFFKEIAQKYPNNPHIIYEVANEPNPGNAPGNTNDAAGWASIKAYAEPIIKMLRDSGNKNIVIVGTPNWSQRPDLAAENPIKDPGVMYTAHFYSGTHKASNDPGDRGNVMSNVRYALQKGVPVFVTEWGTSEASGNNGPFLKEADTWLDFLNNNNISWVNWSLTNKNETSAAFTPYELGKSAATNLDPGADQLWSTKELTVTGEYVRSRIQGTAYQPLDRTAFSEMVWDFNNGTQGFGVNADSPVKTVSLSQANGALKISGLSGSTDISEGNYWANVRLSADGSTARPDLAGAKTMSLDVMVAAPTTVSIAAIPQSAAHGWANPRRAVQVKPDQFVKQADGMYKATLTITPADAPNFEAIANATDTRGSTLTNLVLFVGVQNGSDVWIDNITFSGNRSTTNAPVNHAPLGTVTLPSTFEDSTRQGWDWDAASGVKGALTVTDVNGSKALTWDVMYPDVKPTDSWASAPRLVLNIPEQTRGTDNFLLLDLYLKPEAGRGTEGSLSVNLSFGPPTLGYWAQARQAVEIPLASLAGMTKTADGLYRVQAKFDLNNFDKPLAADTKLGKINLIVADVNSNYAGKMYLDNVRFATTAP